MNPNREEALFQLIPSKPAAKRAAWLDAEYEGDAALPQRLDALLAAPAEASRPTPSCWSAQVIARFEAERQALAMMGYPNSTVE